MTALQLVASGWRRHGNRIDLVWLLIPVTFALLFALQPEQAGNSAAFTVDAMLEVLPYLALAVAAAAYAKASGADNLIARAFHGQVALMIGFAALMGGLSPFCSCGVIPLIAALLAMGVPLAPVMAFWLASPLMDPSMFVLTAGTLGTGFAVAKTAAAIGIGLLGGFGTLALARTQLFSNPLRQGVGNGGCAASAVRAPKPVAWRFWQEEERRAAFGREVLKSSLFLGKWLILAFLLESLMLAYTPPGLFASLTELGSTWSVIIAALVGIPAYFNGYAALPLVNGLIDSGLQPGAGMAFLLAGGVSCIPAAMAVFALTRLPVFLSYLGFALLGSILAGLAYGLVA